MNLEEVPYGGWKTCWRLADDLIELIITAEVGPRVIRLGFRGSENEFKEYGEQSGMTGGDAWRIYGGHRLWHAPEVNPRTYAPDNTPVRLEERAPWFCFHSSTERTTGIAKEIRVRILPGARGEGRVEVHHILKNDGPWTVELAPWAISVMAPGGTAIIPLPPRGDHQSHLQPTSSLALWAYTDLTDPRWTLGRACILLRQDPRAASYQKIGARVSDGWVAYARAGHLFVKQIAFDPAASYPDLGSNAECFTSSDMLELETLGPLVRLQPGQSVDHAETWLLWREVPAPVSEQDVQQRVLPRARPEAAP